MQENSTSRTRRLAIVPLSLIVLLFGATQRGHAQNEGVRDNTSEEREKPDHRGDSGQAASPDGDSGRITLPVGTTISVRIADTVNSSHNHAGDLVTGTVDPSVLIDNRVVIPRGTEAHVRVMEDKKGGRVKGKADISLELDGLVLNRERLDVDSDDYRKKQGALSAKLKGTATAGAEAAPGAATSPTPETGAAGPVMAIFRAAKVQIPAGTRIPFTLTTPFTFDLPDDPPASADHAK